MYFKLLKKFLIITIFGLMFGIFMIHESLNNEDFVVETHKGDIYGLTGGIVAFSTSIVITLILALSHSVIIWLFKKIKSLIKRKGGEN